MYLDANDSLHKCLLGDGTRADIHLPCLLSQLGHQAANCTNGTINWKQIYGEEAFRLKAPLYESDFDRLRKVKQVDFDDLAKRATEYAKVSCCCDRAQCRTPLCTGGLPLCEGWRSSRCGACELI